MHGVQRAEGAFQKITWLSISFVLIKGGVEPSGIQQTPNVQVLSTAETSDPLFYPSWYKSQARHQSKPNKLLLNEAVGQIKPSIPKEMTVKKIDPAAGLLMESVVVAGKKTSPSTDNPQVSDHVHVAYLCNDCATLVKTKSPMLTLCCF